MADRIWRGDAVAVAQVVTMTPGTIVAGREYSLRINGKRVAVTASGTSAAGLVALLVSAVNASTIPEWREVVASGSAVLVLTSRAAGVPFTVYPEVGGFSVNGALVVTVRNTPTGGTWLFDAGLYGAANVTYNSSAATLQGQTDTLFGSGNTLVTLAIDGTDRVYTVSFIGALASAAVPAVTVSYASLTGGDAALVIATVQTYVVGTTEVQTITLIGASGGTFKLTFAGVSTGNLAYNISTAALQTALQALSTIGSGNVTVSGTAGASYVLTFAGDLAHVNVPTILLDDALLTAAKASVAETTPGVSGRNEVQLVRIHQTPGNDEVFKLTRTGTVSGGTFTITANGHTSAALAYNATAQQIAAAISSVIYDVVVAPNADQIIPQTGQHLLTPDSSSPIYFQPFGDLSYRALGPLGAALTVNSSLTGGGSLAFANHTTGSNGGSTLAFPSQWSPESYVDLTYGGTDPENTVRVSIYDTPAAVLAALQTNPAIGLYGVGAVANHLYESIYSTASAFGLWKITFGGPLGGADVALMTAAIGGGAFWTADSAVAIEGGATGTSEVQTLSISGSPSAGTFKLTFGGQQTGSLAYNATSGQVQTELRNLSTIGGAGVTCTGGALPGTPVVITFGGPLAGQDVALITAVSYDMGYSVVVTTPGVTGYNEIQRLSMEEQEVWGGTLTLTWSGQTTTAIAYNATANDVATALIALSNIGAGEVECTGGPWPEAAIDVEWSAGKAEADQAAITSTSSLKNGVAEGESFDPMIQSLTVRATGPNHWNDGVNWYNPAAPTETRCPERHDTVWITEGDTDILYGAVQMVAFTVDAANDWVIPAVACDLVEGQIVETWNSGGALPAGLAAATAYYVTQLDNVTGKFKLSTSAGGAVVNITGAGTGTHTIGVRLDRWFQSAQYTGNVGLTWTNESDYKEYRPLYVVIGFNASGTNGITIGQGDGAGTSRTNIHTGNEALALFEVLNSNGSRETGVPAVNWLGSNAATVIQVLGGDVGVAMRVTETAAFGSLVIRGGSVGLGTVTFATLDQTGGTLGPVNALTLSGVAKIRG